MVHPLFPTLTLWGLYPTLGVSHPRTGKKLIPHPGEAMPKTKTCQHVDRFLNPAPNHLGLRVFRPGPPCGAAAVQQVIRHKINHVETSISSRSNFYCDAHRRRPARRPCYGLESAVQLVYCYGPIE